MASSTVFGMCAWETKKLNVSFGLVEFKLPVDKEKNEDKNAGWVLSGPEKFMSSKTRSKSSKSQA